MTSELKKMRAVVQDTYGDAEVWSNAEVARPEILDNEVLVCVHAAGLDRGTWHVMTGLPYLARLALGFTKPKNRVPGLDLAGTVEAVGSAVTRFTVGDEVFGTGRGSFAEYAAVREDKLARKPVNLTFDQAAVVPVSGLTAIQAVQDHGRVQPGQRVLVIGASGGVGSYAVQIAFAAGANVTGVCSASKSGLVRSLGAYNILDYAVEDFADGTRYDVIIDIGGNSALRRLRRALTHKGTLVIVGGEGGGRVTGGIGRQLRAVVLSMFIGQRLTMLISTENYADLERLTVLIEAGSVVPSVDRAYPLSDAADAMRHLVAGHARGKIAITIA